MRHLDDKIGFFGRRGTFWHEGTTPNTRTLVQHMSHSAALHGADRVIERAINGVNTGGAVYSVNFEVPWKPLDVVTLGADLQARFVAQWAEEYGDPAMFVIRRPATVSLAGEGNVLITWPEPGPDTFILQTTECEYILLPVDGETPDAIDVQDLETRWAVPIPLDTRPCVISVGGRYLVAGIDFMYQRGVLIFKENPYEIFKDNSFLHCLSGWHDETYLLDYTLATDYDAAAQRAVNYFYRSSQSPVALRNALADISGRWVTDADIHIAEVQSWCGYLVYRTTDGRRLEIPYRHDPYEVGDFIPAGEIFGGGIRVGGGRPNGGMWHRAYDWSAGIPLEEISPFTGLTIPDAPMRFEAAEAVGGTFHVRPHVLANDPGNNQLANYWEWIKMAELASGLYLNDIFGFASVGDNEARNGVDFYFEHCLGEKGLVIELDQSNLGGRAYERCRAFAEKHKLHNTVLLIRTI